MKAWEFNCQRMHNGCCCQDFNTVLKWAWCPICWQVGKQLSGHFLKTDTIFIPSTYFSAWYIVGTQQCVQWSRKEECVTTLFLELLCDSLTVTPGAPRCLPPRCAGLALGFPELAAPEHCIHSSCRHVQSLSTSTDLNPNSFKLIWALNSHERYAHILLSRNANITSSCLQITIITS